MHFEHIEHFVDQAAKRLPAVEEAPNWQPLEALIGPALIGQFMHMGTERQQPDGTAIELYKHGMTRRYLNISADLRTWVYLAGQYVPRPLGSALGEAFAQCEELGALPNVAYDADFRNRRDAALIAAGYRSLTVAPGRGLTPPTHPAA
ncbi:MAG: hypothetical protein U0836_16295 [Pirellulales bacterium]